MLSEIVKDPKGWVGAVATLMVAFTSFTSQQNWQITALLILCAAAITMMVVYFVQYQRKQERKAQEKEQERKAQIKAQEDESERCRKNERRLERGITKLYYMLENRSGGKRPKLKYTIEELLHEEDEPSTP